MADRVARIILVARAIVGLFLRWMLFLLSVNLLYLYYLGQWYDPNPAIETAEVVVIYCVGAGALVWAWSRFRQFQKEYRDAN